MKYATLYNKRKTPQSRPIPGAGQVPNSAGGYAWQLDKWTQLDRFLILGSEDGTYYIGARKLTEQNAENVIALIKEDGTRVVSRIVEVSQNGLAPKNEPAIFALALATAVGDEKTKALAFNALPLVARTGTHLFSFAAAVNGLRGWGRGLRNAIGRWYGNKDVEALEYQLLKYKQRDGWSNRDLLRLAHAKPKSDAQKALYKWAVSGEIADGMPLVQAAESLKVMSARDAAKLIIEKRIPREAIPTELLNEAAVWEALLQDMPLTAMIRNLGNLSKCGLLTVGSDAAEKVVLETKNVDRLKKARVHPIAILAAQVTYASGKGARGDGAWIPVPTVVDALNDAFYSAFANVESSGKRIVLGLDVSGSMASMAVNGLPNISCSAAASAMALVTLASEKKVTPLAFSTKAFALALSAKQRLSDVTAAIGNVAGGGTNCALPMLYAIEEKIEADAFVIYTDSETWYGSEHPVQAVEKYRQATGIGAKLVVVAMASNRYTIGNVADPLTLNVIGFDSTVPSVISRFLVE